MEEKNTFFDTPAQDAVPIAETPKKPKVKNQPKADTKADVSSDIFDYWDQETEYREPNAKADTDSDEEPTPEADTVNIDPEAVEFAADLAVGMNQEGMSRVLHWMHNEGEVEDYRTANESVLHSAWSRFFKLMNIEISANKGVIYANVVAFGWSLGLGVWKLIARVLSGAFKWPWSRKKKEKVEVEIHRPEPLPKQVKKDLNYQDVEEAIEVDIWKDKPFNICKETDEKFTPGTGYPKDKNNVNYDKFINRGAFQAYTNKHRKSEKDEADKAA